MSWLKMKIELHRHTYNGQPQGLSLRLSRGRCIAKTAFHNVGAAFHRRPQDFAKADTGIRKKRHAPTACSNSVCPAAQKTGGHRDPPLQDFIQADVGRTRLFLLPSKSRDSPRVGTRRGTPGEGSPRQNSPPDCFASLLRFCDGKEFRSVRGATKDFTFGFHRL